MEVGTRIDEEDVGRAESTGCVNSGRRWHRRIPSQVNPISRGHSCLWPGTPPLRSGHDIKECHDAQILSRATAAAALAILVSGCALTTRHSTVQEIKYNPGRYHDRKVAIDGVVTSSWGVPLVPFKLYKVDDGTGEVTVVSQGGRTPTRGVACARHRARERDRGVRRIERRPPHLGNRPRLQAVRSGPRSDATTTAVMSSFGAASPRHSPTA